MAVLVVPVLALVVLFGFRVFRHMRLKLASGENDPFHRVVYGDGVFGVGLTMWPLLAIMTAYADTPISIMRWVWIEDFAYQLYRNLVIGFPIALFCGYGWGRFMAAVFGWQRPAN